MKERRKRFCKGRTVRAPDTASFGTISTSYTKKGDINMSNKNNSTNSTKSNNNMKGINKFQKELAKSRAINVLKALNAIDFDTSMGDIHKKMLDTSLTEYEKNALKYIKSLLSSLNEKAVEFLDEEEAKLSRVYICAGAPYIAMPPENPEWLPHINSEAELKAFCLDKLCSLRITAAKCRSMMTRYANYGLMTETDPYERQYYLELKEISVRLYTKQEAATNSAYKRFKAGNLGKEDK